MEGWVIFWKVVLYVSMALFFVLSVWVMVAGVGDIKAMFAQLSGDSDGDAD